eukprot:TRINITY_DN22693_c1_g3_i1.p1 TRINITY_DN22693_c1_g3~~TRINITY_DN22693_c1_g3_i1.p1  ORF type:complete len:287 (+),score=12.83 TRINITY_DN22693_c1_g3_i1:570-1430(+)
MAAAICALGRSGIGVSRSSSLAFVACPRQHMAFLKGLLSGTGYLAYWCGQVCLAYMAVHRLQLMKQERVAWQCRVLARLMSCFGFAALLAVPLYSTGFLPRLFIGIGIAGSGVLYIVRVLSGLLQAAFVAFQEDRTERSKASQLQSRAAVSRNTGVLLVAVASALSSGTTVAAVASVAVMTSSFLSPSIVDWIIQFVIIVDIVSDTLFAAVCAGVLCPSLDPEHALAATGDLVEAARRRQVLSALTEAARAATGPSAALAALFEGQEPEDLLQAAVKRFRCSIVPN